MASNRSFGGKVRKLQLLCSFYASAMFFCNTSAFAWDGYRRLLSCKEDTGVTTPTALKLICQDETLTVHIDYAYKPSTTMFGLLDGGSFWKKSGQMYDLSCQINYQQTFMNQLEAFVVMNESIEKGSDFQFITSPSLGFSIDNATCTTRIDGKDVKNSDASKYSIQIERVMAITSDAMKTTIVEKLGPEAADTAFKLVPASSLWLFVTDKRCDDISQDKFALAFAHVKTFHDLTEELLSHGVVYSSFLSDTNEAIVNTLGINREERDFIALHLTQPVQNNVILSSGKSLLTFLDIDPRYINTDMFMTFKKFIAILENGILKLHIFEGSFNSEHTSYFQRRILHPGFDINASFIGAGYLADARDWPKGRRANYDSSTFKRDYGRDRPSDPAIEEQYLTTINGMLGSIDRSVISEIIQRCENAFN